MAKFCSECGSPVAGMSFCAACGTPVDGAPDAGPVATRMSHHAQVEILEREIAELANERWRIYGRAGPYEVCLTRKSGLTARQFLPLWVEEDGSLWTNASGAVEGGRLRDIPSLLSRQEVTVRPTLWKPAPESDPTPSRTPVHEIAELAALRERGVLTDEEFQAAKQRLLLEMGE